MNPTPPSLSTPGLEDPRRRSDFLPQYYPLANHQEASLLDAVERNDRIKLEFLAAYYGLNCEYSKLLVARQGPPSPERDEAEKRILQAVEKRLIIRDQLEDQYAPFGVIADPAVKNGFTVNVIFSFGNMDAAGRRRSELYTITARVPIPLPQEIRFEDLSIKIEGPGINPE